MILDHAEMKERESYHKILVATSRTALSVYLQNKENIDPTVIRYQRDLVKMYESNLKTFYKENGMDKNGE